MKQPVDNAEYVNRAVEASIYIGLTVMLATACLLILRPFIPLVSWGIIIAVAAYPGFRKVQVRLCLLRQILDGARDRDSEAHRQGLLE